MKQKNFLKTFLFMLMTLSITYSLKAQTTLSKGDIAIVAYSTPDDSFAFVTFVELEAGTQIYFTDEEADGDFTIGLGEGHLLYTAPSVISAGTVITGNASATNFTVASSSWAPGNKGDGVIAYQGSSVGEVTTFLHAVGEDAGDIGTLPANTLATNEYVLFGNDDGNYTGTTSGTAADLFSAINNVANWTTGGSLSLSAPASFTVSSGSDPSIGFDEATSTVNETDATFSVNVPVTVSNYDGNQIDMSVAVTGGTAEVADYTLNTTSLSFTADGTQNVSIDIVPDTDDFDDETIILTLTETSSVAGLVISESTHTITVSDDETAPGITLGTVSGNTNESGTTATFTVVLDAQPTTDVVVNVSSGDTGEVSINAPTTLTFTNANWDTAKTVTVTGVDDADVDGNIDVTITVAVDDALSDDAYDSVDDVTTTVTNEDDEVAPAGLQISSANTNFVIDFDNTVSGINNGQFNGLGFTPTPSSGQLDSDAWKTTGMSEGNTAFGDSNTSGDFAKGDSSGGVTSGGFYAFETSTNNNSLGFQPTGSDFNPGTITLRTQNQTGATITEIYLSYIIYVLNNANRTNTLNFEYSTDDTTYTPVGSLDFTSTETQDGSPSWISNNRSTNVSGLSIADGEYFYLRWASDNVGGSGSQDEFAIDDITLNFNPFSAWTGNTDTDWATAGNWSNGVPAATTDVTIPAGLTNYPTVTTAETVNSLTIASGATLVATNASFTVTNNATYSRNLASGSQWYLMSSPVNGENYNNDWVTANSIPSSSQDTDNRGISWYDNSSSDTDSDGAATGDSATGYWRYMAANDDTSFAVGRGYGVIRSGSGDIEFIGSGIYTSNQNFAVTQGENNFNLIGNPFTGFITLGTFYTTNSAVIGDTFHTWNGSSYTARLNNIIDSENQNFEIAPGQGFFVEASSAGNVTFEISDVSHQGTDTFQKNSGNLSKINLFLSEGSNNRSAKLYYIEGTSVNYDPGYDGKLFGGVSHSFALYSHLVSNDQGEKYQVQSLPNSDHENMVIPIGLVADAGKEITFTAEALNLPSGLKVFLEDRFTNTFTRLDEANSAYTVALTEKLDGVGRFYVHTKASALNIDEVQMENISIYTSNASTLRIVGLPQGKASIQLFNILGKQVLQTSFTSNGAKDITLPNVSAGIYIVQLKTATGQLNQKITLD